MQKAHLGWLDHASSHFIPIQKGIILIGEYAVDRGEPYYHLQYVTKDKNGSPKFIPLTQGI